MIGSAVSVIPDIKCMKRRLGFRHIEKGRYEKIPEVPFPQVRGRSLTYLLFHYCDKIHNQRIYFGSQF